MSLMSNSFVSVSHRVFRLFKLTESYHKFGLKTGRVLSNTGCLVAGCCFSKNSDEEPLLNATKRVNEVQYRLFQEVPEECSSMKRSSEIASTQDINKTEIKAQDSFVQSKKVKIDDDYENVDLKTKLSAAENKSSSLIDKDSPEAVCKDHSKETTKQPKKLRPNYFVAVQISNPEIHKSLKNVQDHILKNEFSLKNSMLELKTLHITLMVMYIADTETHTRAMEALKSVHQEYDKEMSDNPLQLEFKGLGHFQNRVLYAKVSHDDSYKRLCDLAGSVKEHFAANAIESTDKRSEFTPHLTVAKIDFKKKKNWGIKKINPKSYRDYVDDYFGSQTIESIQLLSMTNPKNEEGYYSGDEIYFSAFDPTASMNALCEILEIDKKKNDIKEAISSLMKEKLK